MSESHSNRSVLASALQSTVVRFRTAPSTLLAELEAFLNERGLGVDSPRVMGVSGKRPEWERAGFGSKEEFNRFESRSDFPGWENL